MIVRVDKDERGEGSVKGGTERVDGKRIKGVEGE